MTRAMELAAQLAAAEARGSVKEIPGLTERLVGHETEMANLRQQPFVDREIRRRRVEAEARLRKDIGDLVERARRLHLRGLRPRRGPASSAGSGHRGRRDRRAGARPGDARGAGAAARDVGRSREHTGCGAAGLRRSGVDR